MNRDLKAKYWTDFRKVRTVINNVDLCGFIAAGAPDDEYDGLTNRILSDLYNNKSKEEIKKFIIHEIEHHYETPDINTFNESEKSKFFSDIETLIDNAIKEVQISVN